MEIRGELRATMAWKKHLRKQNNKRREAEKAGKRTRKAQRKAW